MEDPYKLSAANHKPVPTVMLSRSEASLATFNQRSFASAAACAQDDKRGTFLRYDVLSASGAVIAYLRL
jgi:hypothetical protein